MEWIADPSAWVGLLTLVLLEIVLGVDNLIFLAILSDRLPPGERERARLIGLSLALGMRLALLASIAWVMSLTAPLLELWRFSFSWRDLILIAGGLFLLVKATTEMHERLDAQRMPAGETKGAAHAFWPLVAQIVVLDAVFSLDSVITAVGMVDELAVMMTAVVIAVGVMLAASGPLTRFILAHPSLIILCLGFLLMVGLVLVVDGFGVHVPKGYVYSAIGFSILIEMLNQWGERSRRKSAERVPARARVAEAVLRMLGGVPQPAPALAAASAGFAPEERHMVKEVLGLAERPVRVAMTPREQVTWIDSTAGADAILDRLRGTIHREFPVGAGSLDAVEGVVRKEDVLARALDGKPLELKSLVRHCARVPEGASLLDTLRVFKRAPIELALVTGDDGKVRGVVTRTDLLEAIAGELPELG